MTDGGMLITFLIKELTFIRSCWLNGVTSAHIQTESVNIDIILEKLSSRYKRIQVENFASGLRSSGEKDECFQVNRKS